MIIANKMSRSLRIKPKYLLYWIAGIVILLTADYFLYPHFSKIGGRSFNEAPGNRDSILA